MLSTIESIQQKSIFVGNKAFRRLHPRYSKAHRSGRFYRALPQRLGVIGRSFGLKVGLAASQRMAEATELCLSTLVGIEGVG